MTEIVEYIAAGFVAMGALGVLFPCHMALMATGVCWAGYQLGRRAGCLLFLLCVLGCGPVGPMPETELDRLQRQYDAIIVIERDLGTPATAGYARLHDGRVWISSGAPRTERYTGTRAEVERGLCAAMRMGVRSPQFPAARQER